jgi:hypothetical protein
MSRTGSTSEQKPPTRGQARLRLVLLATVLMVVATTASAGWQVKSVTGTPTDVEVWAPGVYSVATTSQGAWLDPGDGGTPDAFGTNQAVGTYYNPLTGCFMIFRSSNNDSGFLACGHVVPIFPGLTTSVRRVKATPTSASYAVGRDTVLPQAHTAWTLDGGSRAWTVIRSDLSGMPTNALAVMNMGGSEDAVFALKLFSSTYDGMLYWYRDGVEQGVYSFPDPGYAPIASNAPAMAVFAAEGTTPTALFGWVNSLYRGTLVAGGGNPFTQVFFPGGEGSVTAVSVNTEAGSEHGRGFGMATVQRDGGVTLLSAVPAVLPEDIGAQWRVHESVVPAALTAPRFLDCYGAKFCVVAQQVANANNVFVYTNDAPPTLTVAPVPGVVTDSPPPPIPIRASDPDGDAVRVSVSSSSPPGSGFSVSTTEADGGVDLMLSAAGNCVNRTVNITIAASDGLADHDAVQDHTVQLLHTLAPGMPTIEPSRNITVRAGSAPQILKAQASCACGIASYRWTRLSMGSPGLDGGADGGAIVEFPVPATVCEKLGQPHLYRVEAIDNGGLISPPADVTIQVLPWGAPEKPFKEDQEVRLFAGNSPAGRASLTPETPGHKCEARDAGFPGLDTVWEVTDGGAMPPGVRLLTEDGGLVAQDHRLAITTAGMPEHGAVFGAHGVCDGTHDDRTVSIGASS